MKKFFLFVQILLILSTIGLSSQNLSEDDYLKYFGKDNWGTKFFMTFHPGWEDGGGMNSIYIYVLAKSKTDVTLEIKGKNIKRTLTTVPNDIVIFTLTTQEAFCYSKGSGANPFPPNPAKVWVDNAIIISSKEPISVSGMVKVQYTTDGYLALPVHHYGTQYQVASYADPTTNIAQFLPSYTSIVGVYDNTKFTFKLGGNESSGALIENGDTLKLGETIERNINEGDVWLVAGIGAYNDLTGSVINSDKPIAVYSGNFCAYVPTNMGSCDYLIEQDIPTEKWGNHYYITPIINRAKFPIIKIFAREPNTIVYADSVPVWKIITPGGKLGDGFIEARLGTGTLKPVIIHSDELNPINVILYNTGQQDDNVPSEPFQLQVAPKEQFKSEYFFHIPGKNRSFGSFSSNYINIVYKATVDSLIPNDFLIGSFINGEFNWSKLREYSSNPGKPFSKDAPDSEGRKYFSKTIQFNNDSNSFILKANDKFGLSLYGFSDYESYGYTVGQMSNLLDSKDSLSPIFSYTQSQPGLILGHIEDISQSNDIKKSKLALIFQIDSLSSNSKFILEKYIIGIDTIARFKIMPINCDENGYSTIYISDRNGNDTIVTINNSKAELSGFNTELIKPFNNDTVTNKGVEFNWKKNHFAESYSLIISRTINFTDTIYFNQAIDDTTIVVELPNNHNYYFKVKVNNSCWETNWTESRKFLLSTFGYLKIVYVNKNALGQNNGKNWVDAFNDLQTGLDSAAEDVQVWVAQETYYPKKEFGGIGQRFRTFLINNNIYLYGGFLGNENDFNLRDFQTNKCILDGDIGLLNDSSDNCYHVITYPPNIVFDKIALIDGFTITNGNANGSVPDNRGGGLYINKNGNPTIRNCSFIKNSASYRGGAVYNGETNLSISNSNFQNNYSGTEGGAIFNYSGNNSSFNGCAFKDNVSGNGGAIYNYFTRGLKFAECEWNNNIADLDDGNLYSGGGIYSINSDIQIISTKFQKNNSRSYGGAIYSKLSNIKVEYSDISYNQSWSGGGLASFSDTINISNSLISYNNSTQSSGGGVYANESSFNMDKSEISYNSTNSSNFGGGLAIVLGLNNITDCSIKNNKSAYGGGINVSGLSTKNVTLNLTNCDIYSNQAGVGAGISKQYGTLTLKNCYLRSNKSTGTGGGIYTDGANFINCKIHNNEAIDAGGIFSKGTLILTNSQIDNNIVSGNGGGVYCTNSMNSTNSTIVDNKANLGGGIYLTGSVTNKIKNTIIWNNSAFTEGKQIYKTAGTLNINNSCYSNSTGDVFGSVVPSNCIYVNPEFLNQNNKDYRLDKLSPCIDKGNDSYISEIYDIRGEGFPRKLNGSDGSQIGNVDIGSFEFNSISDTLITNPSFNIFLTTGWNLISTHIQPQLPDSMNNVLDDVAGNMLIAKNISGAVYIPQYDINTIGKWDLTQGYQLYMTKEDTLTITGAEVIPNETPIQLKAGWNMIAYLRNAEMSTELALASITDNNNLLIAKTLDGKVYIPSYNINTIGNMKPGVGYRVYVTTSDTLVYPNN